MKAPTLVFALCLAVTSVVPAAVNPGEPVDNGLIPRTDTFDINTDLENSQTESYGVGVAGNGNVIIGWEDDSTTDANINFWGGIHAIYDGMGNRLSMVTTVTNYDGSQSINTFHRAYYRADGTPTPGNTAWGPKVKANIFGNGVGMGATAYALGLEIPELGEINLDAGGGGDFPAVQMMDNDGMPLGYATYGDSDAETAGDIRIGDWDYLSNGNIVIAGESRQEADLMTKFGGPAPNRHVTYKVVTPAGVEVKALSLASESNVDRTEMWHGIGVTANGFALRFNVASGNSPAGGTIRMFDNSGNPTTGNINLAALTGHGETGQGGRGDGTGFHGNGGDAYVHINSAAGGPWLTVLNADGSLRYSRKVAEDLETLGSDRVDAAISTDGRIIAVFDEADTAGFRLPQARLFNAEGTPMGSRFWVSERDREGVATALAEQPRVAWRDGCVVVIWRTLNSPSTFDRVLSARVFNVAIAATGITITSIVDNGGTVTINWTGGGPTYTVTRRVTVTGASTPEATGLDTTSHTADKTGTEAYFQVSSP